MVPTAQQLPTKSLVLESQRQGQALGRVEGSGNTEGVTGWGGKRNWGRKEAGVVDPVAMMYTRSRDGSLSQVTRVRVTKINVIN